MNHFQFFDILSFSSDTDFVDIVITDKNKIKKLRLLCDSGCLVREPICGTPVILLSPKIFDNLYSPEECKKAREEYYKGTDLEGVDTSNRLPKEEANPYVFDPWEDDF